MCHVPGSVLFPLLKCYLLDPLGSRFQFPELAGEDGTVGNVGLVIIRTAIIDLETHIWTAKLGGKAIGDTSIKRMCRNRAC